MSTSEPSTLSRVRGSELPRSAVSFAASMLGPVRAAAFWSAVALPLTYVPMVATGAMWDLPVVFSVLLALNAVAFLVGHGHDPETA
ncbi:MULTISPECIES: hypothetical protein [Halolamina]|uniref:Uncharacterized protein n=1 Tax=Halolamina pelagica TaxID=699431 RepID=A0A1I5SG27_9EURY|nr:MULTISPECIES: hypothetical protein [Halolamina]NHX37076.1 hypothetical protein [Halolamina sp. R1-12]SFP69671.1 hypothetical protein SAMN05216277_106101 [Halolamina pelagica]